jgi:hypothetical protein
LLAWLPRLIGGVGVYTVLILTASTPVPAVSE